MSNKVQFILKDIAGNIGFSPIYNVRIGQVYECDADKDGDVDQADFGRLQACLSGEGVLPSAGCEKADLDTDDDVDNTDIQLFLDCVSAPGIEAAPDCTQ